MSERFVRRRRVGLMPKISEIFSAQQSGLSGTPGLGTWYPGDEDDPPTGDIQGILTEDGTPILTEDGLWIQAENQ